MKAFFEHTAHAPKLLDFSRNSAHIDRIFVSVCLDNTNRTGTDTLAYSTNVQTCNSTYPAFHRSHCQINIQLWCTAKNNSGKCIFTCNSAKFRIYNSSVSAHISVDCSCHHTVFNISFIVLCDDALHVLHIIIKICSYAQIPDFSLIHGYQRLLQSIDRMSVSVQRSTKIRDGKINSSLCLNIWGQLIICALIFLDQIQIIQRINLIRTAACTISASRFHRWSPFSYYTINNSAFPIRWDCKFSILQFHKDRGSCRNGIFWATVSGKYRKCRCLFCSYPITWKTVYTRGFSCCHSCIKIWKKCFKRNSCYLLQISFTGKGGSIYCIKSRQHSHRLIASCHTVNYVSDKQVWHSIVLGNIIAITLIHQGRAVTNSGTSCNSVHPAICVRTAPQIIHDRYCKTFVYPHIFLGGIEFCFQPEYCVLSLVNQQTVSSGHFTGNIGCCRRSVDMDCCNSLIILKLTTCAA